MKRYKKVELIAKNQIVGSYAAGCPSNERGETGCFLMNLPSWKCQACERAQ